MLRFSTDDASHIVGVPDGPLRLWFCSREHLAEWQQAHPRTWPEPDAWPDIVRERPLRVRVGTALTYGTILAFAVFGVVSLVLLLV